jgi:hypothetical protein
VQQIGRGQRVVERAVARPVVEPQVTGERAEPAVGHLVAHQATRQRDGVDDRVGETRPIVARERRAEEAEIEAHVVTDDDGVAEELEERRQHGLDARGAHDHRLRDAREHGDLGRDGPTRVDQGLERAEAFAPAHLDGSDLGDRAVDRGTTRGLEVEDAEGDVAQRRAQVVERPLTYQRRRR